MDWGRERRRLDLLQREVDRAEKALKEAEIQFKQASDLVQRSLEAQEVLQLLAAAVQEKAHRKLAEVVSSCMRAVFENPYELKIDFVRARGKTEAVLLFHRNGEDADPMTASGGGAVDVAGFALRVACLMLHRPPLRRLVVLDEPFKFVSSQYREAVRQMIETLATDLKMQIVMVTHIEELETGNVINI